MERIRFAAYASSHLAATIRNANLIITKLGLLKKFVDIILIAIKVMPRQKQNLKKRVKLTQFFKIQKKDQLMINLVMLLLTVVLEVKVVDLDLIFHHQLSKIFLMIFLVIHLSLVVEAGEEKLVIVGLT